MLAVKFGAGCEKNVHYLVTACLLLMPGKRKTEQDRGAAIQLAEMRMRRAAREALQEMRRQLRVTDGAEKIRFALRRAALTNGALRLRAIIVHWRGSRISKMGHAPGWAGQKCGMKCPRHGQPQMYVPLGGGSSPSTSSSCPNSVDVMWSPGSRPIERRASTGLTGF